MKKLVFTLLVLLTWGCSGIDVGESSDLDIRPHLADNSQNSLDWPGKYRGNLPCADCAGIGMEIHLQKGNIYSMRSTYWGKADSSLSHEGSFRWDERGGIITLEGMEDDAAYRFRVGENVLIKLDGEEQAYHLVKTEDENDIRAVYWKLIEINGQPFSEKWEEGREPHLIFDAAENRVYGSGGCNRFFGTYELLDGQHISFSPIGATRMACENMEVEKDLLEIFQRVDNYSIAEKRLSLQKAKMAPAAVFEAIYLP